jgi:hypothetical protein
MNATRILTGRREAELLAFPSVRRMADILAQRCREASWVRTSIASLERFRAMTGHHDLEELLAQALIEPVMAEETLSCFASALAGYTDSQVSALAMGARLWFRLNGVSIPWRPLPGVVSSPALAVSDRQGVERVILLALIGSGLCLAELLRLRLGDVGSLDSEGHLIPDIEADPLAVQYTSRRGKKREYITFLTYHTRQALLASLQPYTTAGRLLDLDWPLIAQAGKGIASLRPATRSSVTHARKRSRSLIRAGSDVNVALCMTTGDFFRE